MIQVIYSNCIIVISSISPTTEKKGKKERNENPVFTFGYVACKIFRKLESLFLHYID